MKLKYISSAIFSTILTVAGSVGLNVGMMVSPIVPAAQAQSAGGVNTLRGCFLNSPFIGTIAFNPTNIRQQPTTDSAVVGQFKTVGERVTFSGINLGKAVNDAWDNQPDNMWYRLDGRGYVASAVVSGYPSRGNCATSNGKAENFFRSMVGVKGVSRYDLGWEYNGQCVTLVVRYLQDVYFNGDRSARAYGHGKDVARGVAGQHPNLFQFKTSGTPKRGAIISFLGSGYDGYYGHVGIVMETSGDSIKILESNYDGLVEQG
jgi:surface antigen